MPKNQFSQFNKIMLGIEKIYEDYAKSIGLTYMSLTVLQIIYHSHKTCTQKNICEDSHYNKQIVNSIIKAFYDKGYIELKEMPEDRRNKNVTLTSSGRKYADDILLPLSEIEEKALSVISDNEKEQLVSLLGRCYEGYKSAAAEKNKPEV